ncbi:MAG TPA: hypothetical protein VIN57_00210 [Magnetovibrio sp.]
MVEILLNTPTGAPTAPNYGGRERAYIDATSQPAPQPTPVNAVNFVQQAIPALAPDVLLAAQQTRENERVRSYEQRQAQAEDQAKYIQDQTDGAAQNAEAAEPFSAEIIPLYNRGLAYSSDNASLASTSTPTPTPAQEAFSRANQAYVRAGASDGRTFAASGFDTASRQTLSPSVNLII